MQKPTARNLISGTHCKTWWDGALCYESSKVEVKLKGNRESAQFAGDMMSDSKLMSLEGTFSISLRKVFSRAAALAEAWNKGEDPRTTFIFKLEDPDAWGYETVKISNAWFDEVPVFTAENGKVIEEAYSGGFTGIEFLDKISEK